MALRTVKWFNNSKESETKSLKEGDRVEFKIGLGRKGPAALNVIII